MLSTCHGGTPLLYRLTLVTGMVECLCFAGVVFGYASLVFVLKEDGYFSQMCVNATLTNNTLNATDCSGQDEQFSLVFTVASFLNNFLSLPNGYLFDRFGTMATRLVGISLYTTGTLLVAFSNAGFSKTFYDLGRYIVIGEWMINWRLKRQQTLPVTPSGRTAISLTIWYIAYSGLLFPAVACISVGGIMLLITNMQVGNLFSAHRSTIITLYNGAFDSSAVVFLIVKVLYERELSLRVSFIVLSICSLIHLLRTFLLMPRTWIPYPLPDYYTYGATFGAANTYKVEKFEMTRDCAGKRGETNNTSTQLEEASEEKALSFRSCVLSWFFLWHVLWLSLMQLRHYLFIGTFNPTLNRLADNDRSLVSQYTNVFAFTQLGGVLCAPWNGLIIDRHKSRPLAAGETEREANLRSSALSLLLTSILCLLFSVSASSPVLPLQYLTFILQVLNRSFLYGGHTAFLSIAFPACHFGKLYGLAMTMSAVISLLQYPCFALVEAIGGDPLYVNIALTVLLLLVFIHPLYVFLHCRKLAQERANTQTVANLKSKTP